MRYMGIDFGTKRVGIALSDAAGDFALPHGVLPNDDHLMQEIVRIAKESSIGTVVCGESRDLSGRKNAIFEATEKFAEKLGKTLSLPVFFEPEFFTSSEAERIQGEGKQFDASAAALILKSFLNKRKTMTDIQQPDGSKITAPSATVPSSRISIDDFAKVELRAGKIMSAEKIENADKLLKLSVDFGESSLRQIVSGIAMHYPNPASLVGQTVMFVTNLEPRTIRGFESNGMILAVSTPDGSGFSLLSPNESIPPGTKAK